jgi:hypothetical protein
MAKMEQIQLNTMAARNSLQFYSFHNIQTEIVNIRRYAHAEETIMKKYR